MKASLWGSGGVTYLWVMKQLFPFCFSALAFFGASAQESPAVDFTHLEAEISIFPKEQRVYGNLSFTFDVAHATDSLFIDAQEMEISKVRLNEEAVEFQNDGSRLWVLSDFSPSEDNKLEFFYAATPKQTMYFVGWKDPSPEYKPQVWTQGQGKYTSHWLPSFDDAREKLEFDLSISFPKGMEVVSNGLLLKKEDQNEGQTRWKYDMDKEMSSYLVAIAAGDYYKEEMTSQSNIPISLYFYPGDEEKVEPTYRHTLKIFETLEQEIGVPYPWRNYKQVPVRDFLYSGMENTTATIFSDVFVTDSIGYADRNYVMVNAHELAHQWFGNAVTGASGEHHWLQEGFSTYYALLAEREIFGADYYYWKLYESAEQLKELSDKGEGQAVLNPQAGSLTFYQKGAWALHILNEMIGEEAFKKGVKSYLETYMYQSVTTEDFITEMEKASGQDLSVFVSLWLEQSAFPATAALESLRKSNFINSYLSVAALKEVPLADKMEFLDRQLDFPVNDYIGQEVVYQLAMENPSEVLELYLKAFQTNNLYVRQAIAISVPQIPEALKGAFESLLEDDSYLTQEAAFYNLWMNFPEDRKEYLEQLKGVEGFTDKNIRILWLALNLATPDYDAQQQGEVFEELTGYTAASFPFYVRENAFQYLYQLNAFQEQNLKDLLEGTQHPVSRFRTFSRELLTELLKNEAYRTRFRSIMKELPEKQREYLGRVVE